MDNRRHAIAVPGLHIRRRTGRGAVLEGGMHADAAPGNLPVPMRRLVFVVTEDWFFASHFLPMARAALRKPAASE